MRSSALFVFLLLLIVLGCKKPVNNQSDKAIAQVVGKVLYQSDLGKIFPAHKMDNADSVEFVNNYITQWIKQQLLVAEAEHSLSTEELDIQQELEKYRQELLIYKYKNKRIGTIVDSVISDREIEDYYNTNLKTFILDREIVQVNYIIFPLEIEIPKTFKTQLISTSENDKTNAEDFIFKFAKKYDDFGGDWIYFDNLTQPMIEKISNPGNYLKTHKLVEFTSENELRLIVINDYRLSGEQAPIEFVSPRIKSLLLNSKKIDFLREIKDSLYNNALKYNKFRVFN